MQIWIWSDLHLASGDGDWRPPSIPRADVAVVAGDVREGLVKGVRWLSEHIRPHMQVVYVAGNHEFYGKVRSSELDAGRREAAALGISFLEDDTVEIGGVVFAGSTLWTDYALEGDGLRRASMAAARAGMTDHKVISESKRPWRGFRPEEALLLHRRSKRFLGELAVDERPLVVVTHHAPSARSIPAAFVGDPLTPAYVSNLDALIETVRPDLWIHGHVHSAVDYMIGATRVVCNPRGYGGEDSNFDPVLVVEVGPTPGSGAAVPPLASGSVLDDLGDDDTGSEIADFPFYDDAFDAKLARRIEAQSSRVMLAQLALDAALSKADLRRIRAGRCLAVVVEVPDAAWAEPVHGALDELAVWSNISAKTGASRSDDRPDKGNAAVADRLAAGGCVGGVSQAPERFLPAALLVAADIRVRIGSPSNALLARVIRRATGGVARGMPDDLAVGLSFDDISGAIRPDTARACVRRLVAAKAAKAVFDPAVASATPFEELQGYGEAGEWGYRLLADLVEVRAGRLAFFDMSRNLVLASEPGLGKTSFVRSLARSAGLDLVSTSVGGWFANSSGYLDGVIKAADAAFEAARAAPRGAILFLDELDALPNRAALGRNADYWTPVVTSILLTLDKVVASKTDRICVIGATNHAEKLDPALVRPGRLDRVIVIEPPNRFALVGIIRQHLGDDLADLDLGPYAELAFGATGAQVAGWVKEARGRARAARRRMRADDLRSVIAPPDERTSDELRRCALHEAGHAVAVTVLGVGRVTQIDLHRRDDRGGAMDAVSAFGGMPTRQEMERLVTGLLAGRAAEVAFLGGPSSGSGGGSRSDLGRATALVAAVHGSLGLGDRLLHLGDVEDVVRSLRTDRPLARAVEADLVRLHRAAEELVVRHRHAIAAIADRLVVERLVRGDVVRRILAGEDEPVSDAMEVI